MTLTTQDIKLIISSVEMELCFMVERDWKDCPRYKELERIISKLETMQTENEARCKQQLKALEETFNSDDKE